MAKHPGGSGHKKMNKKKSHKSGQKAVIDLITKGKPMKKGMKKS